MLAMVKELESICAKRDGDALCENETSICDGDGMRAKVVVHYSAPQNSGAA